MEKYINTAEKFIFGNIGKKIKILAWITLILFVLGGIVTGITIFAINSDDWWGLLITPVGIPLGIVSSWICYGFGQLITNTNKEDK